MIILVLSVAFICKRYAVAEEFTTTLKAGEVDSDYGWSGYYYGYDWDDADVDLCWPINICLQTYNGWSNSDSGINYYYSWDAYVDQHEYISKQYECQSDVPYQSMYYDNQQCSDSDASNSWSKPMTYYPKNYISCNNDCTSYVVIREYSIAYDHDSTNFTWPDTDGYYSGYYDNTESPNNDQLTTTENTGYDYDYDYYGYIKDKDYAGGNGSYGYGWNLQDYYNWYDYGSYSEYEVDCDESVSYEDRIEATGCYPNIGRDEYKSKSISCSTTSYTVKYYEEIDCSGDVLKSVTSSNGCHQGAEERLPYKIEILSCPEPEEQPDTETDTATTTEGVNQENSGYLYSLIAFKFVLILGVIINV